MTALLLTITVLGKRGLWPDSQQLLRLRIAVDHVVLAGEDEDDVQEQVAMVMAQIELHSCFDRD